MLPYFGDKLCISYEVETGITKGFLLQLTEMINSKLMIGKYLAIKQHLM
jgi:hypothetical protein